MHKFAILSVILSYSFVNGDLYSTCYEYETYCLFSFGPNVTVNNVNEAQKICKYAKSGSWLLEIVDKRVLKNVDGFLSNHSFPENTKFILNANKVEEKWGWINNKSDIISDVLKVLKDTDDEVYYHRLVTAGPTVIEDNQYAVVCMIGCYSKLITYENKKILHGIYKPNATRQQCLEYCEARNCELWAWDNDKYRGCWFISPIGNGKTSDSNVTTVYKLDRSVKITDKCIGNIKLSYFLDSIVNISTGMKIMLVLVILLVAINITVAIIFWRKLKKKQEITQELQNLRSDRKLSEHYYDNVDHNFGETKGKTTDESHYTHLTAVR